MKRSHKLPRRSNRGQTGKQREHQRVSCKCILQRAYPSLRLHALPADTHTKLIHKFDSIIPFSGRGDKTGKRGITYWQLFHALSGYNYKTNEPHLVLIKGGFVRDLVQGKSLDIIHDIDVVHTKPFNQALYGNDGIHTLNVQYSSCKDAGNKYFYMKIGGESKDGPDHSVDCTYTALDGFNHYESPVNMMMLNVSVFADGKGPSTHASLNTVYDLTGKGWDHAKKKIWDAPDAHTLRDPFWLSSGKLWRMLKFQRRGYTVPRSTKKAIYSYWLKEYHNVPQYNWDNPWHKHFGGNGAHLQQATENTRVAVASVLRMVANDFTELGMDRVASQMFYVMLLEMNVVTVASRLRDLKRMKVYFKKKKYTKDSVRSLSSSVEQISKNNADIKRLCDILLSTSELTTHKQFCEYAELLLHTNLITAFPIVTLFSPIDTHNLVYTFPLYKSVGPLNVLCFPFAAHTTKKVKNAFVNIDVPCVATKTHSRTHISLHNLLHTKQSVGTRCFVLGADCKRMVQHSIVEFRAGLHLLWYHPKMNVDKVRKSLSVKGTWDPSSQTITIMPKLQWTFASSLPTRLTASVAMDVLNGEFVDWSHKEVVQWVSQ